MIGAILAGAQLAIGVGSAIFGHKAKAKAARAEQQAINRYRAETVRSANESALFQNATLDQRLSQEMSAANLTLASNTRSAAQSVLMVDRSARVASAQSRLSAGAAGVAGASVDALLGDIDRQAATARFDTAQQVQEAERAIRVNLGWTRDQVNLQRRGIEAERTSRINAANLGPQVPMPNAWATGLQIGSSVLDYMGRFQRRPNVEAVTPTAPTMQQTPGVGITPYKTEPYRLSTITR